MMEFKAPKLTKQMNVGVYVAIAASFLLYYQGFYSKNRAILDGLSRSITSEKTALAQNKARYAELASRNPAALTGVGSHESLDKYDRSNRSLANVVDTLAKGDGKSPFAVNKIVTEKQESLDGYTKTLFSLDVDASFLAIGGFLEGLDHSLLLAEVRSVDISRISSELKRCSAKIELESYVVKQ